MQKRCCVLSFHDCFTIARINVYNAIPQSVIVLVYSNKVLYISFNRLAVSFSRDLIGMIVVKTKKCCSVVLGSIIPTTCGWLILPPTIRLLGPIAMGFDVFQDQNNYHFPCIARSLLLYYFIGR